MRPYSQDLRQRILDTVARGEGSLRQIAQRFRVNVSTIVRLLKHHRGTGSAEPKPHGRALEGERVPGAVPGFWTTLTLICGLRLSGVSAPLVFQGATDTATFETYVEQALAPQLHPGDVVIWDNLTPHKAKSVVKAIE